MKKGFTLIELLAVIVILSIIALIAVPIAINIINSSKNSSNKISIELYGKAVEQAVAKYNLTGIPSTGIYVSSNGGKTLTNGTTTLTVDYSVSKVMCETVQVKTDGTVYLDGCSVGETPVDYTYGIKPLCAVSTTLTNGTGILASTGNPYALGVEYTCELGDGVNRTFYVLEAGDNTTLTKYTGTPVYIEEKDNYGTAGAGEVALIMDRNLINEGANKTVAWVSKEDYNDDENYGEHGKSNKGPITALNYLHTQTSTWTKLQSNQIALPTYNQLNKARIANSNIMPTWAYDYLDNTYNSNITHSVRGAYGYWSVSTCSESSDGVWSMGSSTLHLHYSIVANDDDYGVRPVITVLKFQLG